MREVGFVWLFRTKIDAWVLFLLVSGFLHLPFSFRLAIREFFLVRSTFIFGAFDDFFFQTHTQVFCYCYDCVLLIFRCLVLMRLCQNFGQRFHRNINFG